MRSKLCCSKHAHLIPPNQRSKSRFLNIDTISNWGMRVLQALENNDISLEDRSQLKWVKENELLVIEMDFIMSIVQEISILLKNGGLSKQTKTKCISLLSITDLVLIIPALTFKLSDCAVNAAIANCKVKNIELWKKITCVTHC